MAKKYLTAKELQDKKCDLELKIAGLIWAFNQKCADNCFQVEDIKMETHGTDHTRGFNIDIHII